LSKEFGLVYTTLAVLYRRSRFLNLGNVLWFLCVLNLSSCQKKLPLKALSPGDNARLGPTRFEEWLSRSTAQEAA